MAESSVFIIKNGLAFATTIRIKGYSLSRNNYFDMNVRICGSESIARASNSRRFFVKGFVSGVPSSLTEVQRYFIITEATF